MNHRLISGRILALLAVMSLASLEVTSLACQTVPTRSQAPVEAPEPIKPAQVVESPCVQGEPPIFNISVPPNSPVLGDNAQALITIVAFSDFQCPFCGRANNTLKNLLDEYPQNVRIVYRHQPLAFHKDALPAAKASMAAARQGRFQEMNDKLYADSRSLDEDNLFGYASKLGLDMQRFGADFKSEEIAREVQDDIDEANRLGVNGVPAFFVNGRQILGARPLDHFKELIDELLPKAKAAGGAGDELYSRLVSCGHTTKPEQPRRQPAERVHRPREDPDKIHEVPPGDSYWTGSADARVVMVVFSDFQCPYCGRLARTLHKVSSVYPQDVRIVFKHHPLPFHKDAFGAHEAALAAGAQGKFWEMHNIIFDNMQKLERPDLESYAQTLGLDMIRFRSDLDQEAFRKVVEADMALARMLGARGTPTTYINGRKLPGAQPFEKFKEEIDQILGQ